MKIHTVLEACTSTGNPLYIHLWLYNIHGPSTRYPQCAHVDKMKRLLRCKHMYLLSVASIHCSR